MSIPTTASLSSIPIRRRSPVPVAAAVEVPSGFAPPPEWADDLRFFVTCYAAGLIFFLIMLS